MVERHLVAKKLADMADRAARARLHCPATADALGADPDALDLVAFNLDLDAFAREVLAWMDRPAT